MFETNFTGHNKIWWAQKKVLGITTPGRPLGYRPKENAFQDNCSF